MKIEIDDRIMNGNIFFPINYSSSNNVCFVAQEMIVETVTVDIKSGDIRYTNRDNWQTCINFEDLFETKELAQSECDRRNKIIADKQLIIDEYQEQLDKLKHEIIDFKNTE